LKKEELEHRGITTEMEHYIFPLLYVPSLLALPAPAQGPPSPSTLSTQGAFTSPNNSKSSGYGDGIFLSKASTDLWEVRLVMDIPDSSEIVMISSNEEQEDEPIEENPEVDPNEDSKVDPEEDLELGDWYPKTLRMWC